MGDLYSGSSPKSIVPISSISGFSGAVLGNPEKRFVVINKPTNYFLETKHRNTIDQRTLTQFRYVDVFLVYRLEEYSLVK